jgi:GPH family glycoside/pentoside/hexuronide:cation symporter
MSAGKLPLHKIFAYGFPVFAIGLVLAPVSAFLPGLYAKHAQVSLASIGLLFAIARIFDAVTDPLIGYYSDQTRSRFGPRIPWIVVGGLIVTVSSFALFQIPSDAGIGYFGVWSMLFFLGFTMFQIPHMAWGSEISSDYLDRSRIFTVRSFCDSVGGLFYNVAPLLLVYLAVTTTSEFSPEAFQWLSYVVIIVLPLSLVVAVRAAPVAELVVKKTDGLKGLYKGLVSNKPMLRFMAAYVLGGINSGLVAVLTFPFFDKYLGIGDKIPMLLIFAYAGQLVALPFWQKMIEWLGKHNTWAIGWAANSLVMIPLLFVMPDSGNAVLVAGACLFAFGFTAVVSSVAPLALIGDIVDYELLRSGVDRAGNYYAFLLLVAKIAGAGGGIALVVLGAVFGFDVSSDAVNSDFANRGMVWMFCLVPGLVQLLALPFILNFPINRRRHGIIQRRLRQRALIDARQ